MHRFSPFLLISACLIIFLTACKDGDSYQEQNDPQLNNLVNYLSGYFTTTEQAQKDTNFLDVMMHACPIWTEDGHWVYIEQALVVVPERPYRQRIYHLTALGDNQYQSVTYELPEPEKYVGGWREPMVFQKLSKDKLSAKSGCEVYLVLQDDMSFKGGTKDQDCPSSLGGATYTTSEIQIGPNSIMSLDRGFTENGTQVWGSATGPYVFIRADGSDTP